MEIRIELGNWQYNAGIVGLYNILKSAEKDKFAESKIKLEDNTLVFDSAELEGFEEKYFDYLIDLYEILLPWSKIVRLKSEMDDLIKKIKSNEKIEKEDLKKINNSIKILKANIKNGKTYKKAYDMIGGDLNPLDALKKIKEIELNKIKNLESKRNEYCDLLEKIIQLIDYFNTDEGRAYYGGNCVSYHVITNGWTGVSFLFPKAKEKNIYTDYKNYFVEPARKYLESDKKKYKYNCFICDREMKDLKNDFNFLVNTGFDAARKTSHIWEHNNDAGMCDICKLVNSCVPAGFTYVYENGLFINANMSIDEVIRINTQLKSELYDKNEKLSGIYKSLILELRKDLRYELEDIQLVRFENGKYYFNILSKNMIRVIVENQGDFENLENESFREGQEKYTLLDEVMRRVLNNENLFTLIHRAIYSKISIKDKNYIHSKGITAMLKINFNILKGAGYMENSEVSIVARGRAAGKNLRDKYRNKKAEHKLSGICYRILNGLKTENQAMTMDTILNCYLYCKESVPVIITEMLGTQENFKEIGYAFVAGLLAVDYDGNDKNENKEAGK